MAIEHDAIQDGKRHEPKGISTALEKQVYVANGSGSGMWRKLSTSDLEAFNEVYGGLTASFNTSVFAVPKSTDTLLNNNLDYVLVPSTIWDNVPQTATNGLAFTSDSIVVQVKGVYRIEMWASVKTSTNNTSIGFKYAKNGVVLSGRRPKHFLRNAGEAANMSAYGYIQLEAGDEIELYVASDVATNLLIEDATFSLELKRTL